MSEEKVFKVRYTRQATVVFDTDEDPTDTEILDEAESHSELVDWDIKQINKRQS